MVGEGAFWWCCMVHHEELGEGTFFMIGGIDWESESQLKLHLKQAKDSMMQCVVVSIVWYGRK